VNPKKVGPELIVLQQEVQKLVPFCLSDNVIALNLMRARGTIKGKRTEDRSWIRWIEDKEESK
jgi:hypothetical protein